LVAVTCDQRGGEKWCLLYTDGLYHSVDGGDTLQRILDASGDK
jgi:hypothetical protein